ncbi:MAG: hypothetical protein K0B08_11340, partial [Bacteroidales bacterium]|nr:hypothetical protein [Bacteroidales bacterium]
MNSKILKYNMLIHFRPWPNTVIWFAIISMLWSCVTFSQAVSQNIAFSAREITSFYGDQCLNPHIQPNYKNSGNFHLNYYGSGDVTGDNQITWDDYEAILNS